MRALRSIAVAALCALACLVCAGCSPRPLGTNDVALVYRATGAPPADLASAIRARLGAAQITGDVEITADGARVTVDREESGAVDELLAWRGGLEVYDVAPVGGMLTLREADGISARTETRGGVVDRFYAGPTEAIARAAREAQLPAGERALVARVDATTSRALVVRDPPRIELRDAIASVTSPDGRSLVVRLAPNGSKRVADAMRALDGARVAVARDRSALFVGPLAGDPIVLPFGDDLYAYARARASRLMLETPTLPPLARIGATALPPDPTLAVAALVVPFVLSFAWLFFVRRFDRAHPEPWGLVLATFALGGVSVIPAALGEIGWPLVSPWLNPSLVTMGGRIAALPLALAVFTLVVGLSEEGAKLLGAWSLAFHRREFDEPIDGIVYGAASALGFAAVENVKYFALGRMAPTLIVVRTFLSIPAHLFFGAIWGYALGRKLVAPRTRLWLFLAAAALAHGAFDTFLSIDGTASLALLLNLGLATLFVVLLRRALRHGVVTPEAARVSPKHRVHFGVGAPVGFVFSIIALHLVAASIFAASSYASSEHQRVGVVFIVVMSWLVTLLALAAYALTSTMPLDVVIDDYGVTFAGAARAWATIRGIAPQARGLRVCSTSGDVWIGPAGRDALAPIAQAIAQRMAPRTSGEAADSEPFAGGR